MIELPEARVIADQIAESLTGRVLKTVRPPSFHHKLTWFTGDPADYPARLEGRAVVAANAHGGIVETELEGGLFLWLCDGAIPRLHPPGSPRPDKYQLRLETDEGSAVSVTVAMYGGIQLGTADDRAGMYLHASFTAPSPLGDGFTADYYDSLFVSSEEKIPALSAKAFLATKQRIPGLGNGVLQDLLWQARIHPKRKVGSLSADDRVRLFEQVRGTTRRMAEQGGRDTETDLYGARGGYGTIMSRLNTAMVCPACGGGIRRETYLGGNITYCPTCQPITG